MHLGEWMPLASDHQICSCQVRNEVFQLVRMEIHVAVRECDIVPGRVLETVFQCGTLASILFVSHYSNSFHSLCLFEAVVRAAVYDCDDLMIREVFGDAVSHLLKIPSDEL